LNTDLRGTVALGVALLVSETAIFTEGDVMKKVTFILVGAGERGRIYAECARNYMPELGECVAVCEPNEKVRNKFADEAGIPADKRFSSWEDIANMPKFADAVFVCTQDSMHRAPAVRYADMGYHILLEKPMAPNMEDAKAIYDAVARNKVMLAICHVLRYTEFNKKLKQMIDAGVIGNVRSIQLLEQVGYWHQAHSFVRGNWRNEGESSPMLLSKSCHDMDLLNYFMPAKCVKVSSFGSLGYFNRAHQPKGASDRCVTCPAEIESQCAYSAFKIYIRDRKDCLESWPVHIVTTDATPQGVIEALRTSPYGRCVYACDNDVVDHQVVNLEFSDGATAGFTMCAFTKGGREVFIMGDQGYLRCNETSITHFDFLTDKEVDVPFNMYGAALATGHGGGDYGLVADFLKAVSENDPSHITSGPEVSFESHQIVFAAERARRKNTVESL